LQKRDRIDGHFSHRHRDPKQLIRAPHRSSIGLRSIPRLRRIDPANPAPPARLRVADRAAARLCCGQSVDPVHFSIIFTHNMEIGLVHPPVGLNLFVLSTISSAPVGEVIRGILPFLILLLIVLGIITYVPILTLWLPNYVFG
jgi:Tripartite ATP-independent periplasmic transporter, DctM component